MVVEMIKIILIAMLTAGLWFVFDASMANTTYVQPVYVEEYDRITYFGRFYHRYDRITGVAGYKTIDKMVKLEKISYKDFLNNKIHMVRTLPNRSIVGYGIKVWESEFALEDTNCDGVMDKVFLYNAPVFPPDCFYKEAI